MSNLCNICPNRCNADRVGGKTGVCGVTSDIKIAKYYLHPYEEPIISGTNGSGTIFFIGCALRCVFCQNYELSRVLRGKTISFQQLADVFKKLEDMGAHNINLVTASHYAEQIIDAFKIYKPKIPVVYNTHAYENIETLEKLCPYVDIWLPDLKFKSSFLSSRYTQKKDYFDVATKAILYMMQSKKTVVENGLMKSGTIVRHLILPKSSSDSVEIVKWFIENRKNGAMFSLMAQYTPFGNIENFEELKRKITKREYQKVLSCLFELDDDEYFIQELSSSSEEYIPKWDY